MVSISSFFFMAHQSRAKSASKHLRPFAAPTAPRTIGTGLGGGLVIAGILVALFLSTIIGINLILVGLIAFGGFAKGK